MCFSSISYSNAQLYKSQFSVCFSFLYVTLGSLGLPPKGILPVTASTPWACRRFHSPAPQSCQLPDPQRIVRHEYHSLPSAIVRFVVSPQAKTNRHPKCIISGVLAVFDASSEKSLGTPSGHEELIPLQVCTVTLFSVYLYYYQMNHSVFWTITSTWPDLSIRGKKCPIGDDQLSQLSALSISIV